MAAPGKRAAAQQMLVEIYGWFTEGFDTVDLQEAKVLLEELKASTQGQSAQESWIKTAARSIASAYSPRCLMLQ